MFENSIEPAIEVCARKIGMSGIHPPAQTIQVMHHRPPHRSEYQLSMPSATREPTRLSAMLKRPTGGVDAKGTPVFIFFMLIL
jgi:hypothetical protein